MSLLDMEDLSLGMMVSCYGSVLVISVNFPLDEPGRAKLVEDQNPHNRDLKDLHATPCLCWCRFSTAVAGRSFSRNVRVAEDQTRLRAKELVSDT